MTRRGQAGEWGECGSEALRDTEKGKELNRGEVCSGAEDEGTEKVN